MIDLATYTPKGGKENSDFFVEYLPKVFERRVESGLDEVVDRMVGVVVQVEHGDAVSYLAELAAMGPYRLADCRLTGTHRVFVLRSQPEFPRLVVLEPLSASYEDEITRWNELYPRSRAKPNARYVGEIYRADSVAAVRDALEPQNIRFVYPGDQENDFYARDHLTFTFLSDFTTTGWVTSTSTSTTSTPSASASASASRPRSRARSTPPRPCRRSTASPGWSWASTMATRILAGEREDAILEYLTMVPYYFWGAYNITETNSSTNVTRHPNVDDDKLSPARVFTANNTPSFVNSFEQLPMPTEDFVRNFGRRMQHMAFAVTDGHMTDEKTWTTWCAT